MLCITAGTVRIGRKNTKGEFGDAVKGAAQTLDLAVRPRSIGVCLL